MPKRIEETPTEQDLLKNRAMIDLKVHFPGVSEYYLELAYDFCMREPERAERIMKGEEVLPPAKPRPPVDGEKILSS